MVQTNAVQTKARILHKKVKKKYAVMSVLTSYYTKGILTKKIIKCLSANSRGTDQVQLFQLEPKWFNLKYIINL